MQPDTQKPPQKPANDTADSKKGGLRPIGDIAREVVEKVRPQ